MKRLIFYLLPLAFLLLMANTFPPAEDPEVISEVRFTDLNASFDMEAAVAEIKASIKGKEKEPAENVFKNIQLFKGWPAGRVVATMEEVFTKALGVDCTHCHRPAVWESEEKPAKQITREMWHMMVKINGKLLLEIPELQSDWPAINCTTCHRGQVKPAVNLKN